MAEQSVIDLTTMRELVEFCGEDALKTLIQTFLDYAPQQVVDMETGCQTGNCLKVSSSAHTFRSGAGSLGLQRLYPLAVSLEERADRRDTEAMDTLVTELRREFDLATAELKAILADPSKVNENE